MKIKYVELQKYNETIKSLRDEIKNLKEEISRKPSDEINAAKNALSKCTEYKNRSETSKNEIDSLLSDISTKNETITKLFENIKKNKNEVDNTYKQSLSAQEELDSLQDKIEVIDSLFSKKENLAAKINELDEFYSQSEDLHNKIEAAYKTSKERRNEIDALYYEINGYEEKDKEDETESKHIPGLKDKLKESYAKIQKDLKETEQRINDLEDKTANSFDQFISSRKNKYDSIVAEIEDLLPKALTTGLSYAFSEKKDNEIESNKILSKQFRRSIIALSLTSFIPIAVSLYLLSTGQELLTVIKDIPNMVFAVLPLYIPIVWFTYSTSKKLNLSKRLIEEYTHKEVLSKTFEGLSKQIQNIEDKEISSELKIKLLYNILSVNSENPGKLISDYNKADHPIIDALDKSAKLSDAVDSLSKIPGLSKLSKILDKKAERIQKVQEEKVIDGLETKE
jgi:uncharacterized coiled-coil DUF342 family protein